MFLVQQNAFLSGITPQTAPGLVIGDFLVVCSDYTGDPDYDPYTFPVGGAAAGVLGNTTMSPLFFQTFAALTATQTEATATMSGDRDGVTVTVSDPFFIDAQGAFLAVLPETEGSFGTYVFRLIRIVDVPANPAVAYSGDVFELGVTVNDDQLLTWGEQ